MNRKAIIELAMEAANDHEWGYDSAVALEKLKEIDPTSDWEVELLQAELEAGHREMGPRRPPTEMELTLMRMYEPAIREMLKENPLVRFFEKDDKIQGGTFVVPLEIK